MAHDLSGFKLFVEKDEKKKPTENYLDGEWRELGIDPNTLPEYIETGPIELEDEGLWFNQAVWQIVKPIDLKDRFVRIKFHKSKSPNLNQRVYVRRHDGQMVPYEGDPSGQVHLIPIKKLAEIMGRAWQTVLMGQQAGMGGMGGGF